MVDENSCEIGKITPTFKIFSYFIEAMIVIKRGNKKNEFEVYKKENEEVKKFNLILEETPKGYRPKRFREGEVLLKPKDAINLLRNGDIYTAEECKEMEEMLEDFNLSYDKISLCRFCLIEGKINTMKKGYRYHGETICEACAKKEIFREMRYRNIDSSEGILKVLKRLKDVDKVLRLFDPRFDLDPEITKFDEIEAHSYRGKKIESLNIPDFLKKSLKNRGIKELFPTQSLAIDNGLLEGKNLLIASATASGKTLIGELAGVPNISKGKKLLFLVPLVALANQKYEEFKRNYSFRVALRVGISRIKTKEFPIIDTDIDAEIIVGTYEGIDFLLRSGRYLGEIGTIVIDELHMLDDEERGARLDGLVSRLRTIYPEAQFIGLSATIGNVIELAKDLDLKPVENKKKEIIRKLAKKEWETISKKGYHGQSIVFTYSRRKCGEIASYLQSRGITARSYHAGLSYVERKNIEEKFWDQKIKCVVTTAALSAGVDFPSSQVIFESLQMGINVLKAREFHQMLGRAGRPDFHEKGKVYLLIDPLKDYRETTEDKVAFELLQSSDENVEVKYTEDMVLENLLANLCCSSDKLEEFNRNSLQPMDLNKIKILEDFRLVKNKKPTLYGKAVSISFLNIKEAEFIRKNLNKDILEGIVFLERFENVYITNTLQSTLELKSAKLFSGEVLEAMARPKDIKIVEPLILEFFNCDCKDYPYCECPIKNVSRKIIEYRLKGYSPKKISKEFLKYNLILYSGDVFSYLNSVVHRIEAFERIAHIFNKKRLIEIQNLKKRIEKGSL